ncbi:MAG TPA: tyrosine--tRNA ligase [Nitrosopumilaceae archaeon]|nr:tyrosine--tRNA ligase [Nitrosopumilaceae archaeon]
MDVTEKIAFITRDPTEEVVTSEELVNLFNTNSHPKHYIGLEISGFLHLGSLILTGFKINDFIKAGVKCSVFLADWHTFINDKLGGNLETIKKVSEYYADAFRLLCPGIEILQGSKLYDSRKEYWTELIQFAKHMSLSRAMRTLTIMGRTEKDKLDLAQMLYAPMQAVDIHAMDLDIVHSGMDQRKIHMLVREIFPKMKWKVPVAIHHRLLPGLAEPEPASGEDGKISSKMSKSKPSSGIFIHDSDDEIRSKIKKSWCPEGIVENNPLLAISRHIILHEFKEILIERPTKFGGNITYTSYAQLELDFSQKKLHPTDLKSMVERYLINIISPLRERINLKEELLETIKKSV